jgi:hypothetical protein
LTIGHKIACHCNLFSIPAFFGSGYVASANFQNNNMSKVRWTQGKHMISMQEYEKYKHRHNNQQDEPIESHAHVKIQTPILRPKKITTRKKGTVVWPAMFFGEFKLHPKKITKQA